MTNGRAADENQLANGRARPQTTTSKKVMPVDASGDGRNRTLAVIADELRAAIKSDTANIIKKGKLLQEAKEQLPEDGKWLRWLEEQFSMTDRTAQKYIVPSSALASTEFLRYVCLPNTTFGLQARPYTSGSRRSSPCSPECRLISEQVNSPRPTWRGS